MVDWKLKYITNTKFKLVAQLEYFAHTQLHGRNDCDFKLILCFINLINLQDIYVSQH